MPNTCQSNFPVLFWRKRSFKTEKCLHNRRVLQNRETLFSSTDLWVHIYPEFHPPPPSKDCKEQAWHTYNVPSVTSTAISSDVNRSLRKIPGREMNKPKPLCHDIALHKYVKCLKQKFSECLRIAYTTLQILGDCTLPSDKGILCSLSNGNRSAEPRNTAASGRSQRASRTLPCASCPPCP
jgi:hypothetical protein